MCKLCFTQALRVFPSPPAFSTAVKFSETETVKQIQCSGMGLIIEWLDPSYSYSS